MTKYLLNQAKEFLGFTQIRAAFMKDHFMPKTTLICQF